MKLEVFHPQLRVERVTRRGVVRIIEPVFPGYIFVKCVMEDNLQQLQRTNGVSALLHFGGKFSSIPDRVMEELQECFGVEESMPVRERLSAGDEVVVGNGALAGRHAYVLRLIPARRRVQILLDILGGPIPIEVDRSSVMPEKSGKVGQTTTILAGAN